MNGRISREELVKIYNIEITFFDSLEESGLLKPETENNVKYLAYEELPLLERFSNWHYDLDVNIPGIEIIHDLLGRMEALRRENRALMAGQFPLPEHFEDF